MILLPIDPISILRDRFHNGLCPHQHACFAEKMESFDMHRPAMKLGDDDRKIFRLAEFILLVRHQAALFFREAEEFGDRIIEESFGDMLFVESEIILEMVAEGLLVLLVPFAGEAFDQPPIRQGLAGETSQLRDGLSGIGNSHKVTASIKKPHGDFKSAEDPRAAGIDVKKFGVQTAVVDQDGKACGAGFFVVDAHKFLCCQC